MSDISHGENGVARVCRLSFATGLPENEGDGMGGREALFIGVTVFTPHTRLCSPSHGNPPSPSCGSIHKLTQTCTASAARPRKLHPHRLQHLKRRLIPSGWHPSLLLVTLMTNIQACQVCGQSAISRCLSVPAARSSL